MAPLKNNPQVIPDRISSDLMGVYDDRFEKDFAAHIAHENTRKRIKDIFDDCIDSVPVMDKIRGYASREINEKIFKNGWAIFAGFATLIVSAVIGSVVTRILGR